MLCTSIAFYSGNSAPTPDRTSNFDHNYWGQGLECGRKPRSHDVKYFMQQPGEQDISVIAHRGNNLRRSYYACTWIFKRI